MPVNQGGRVLKSSRLIFHLCMRTGVVIISDTMLGAACVVSFRNVLHLCARYYRGPTPSYIRDLYWGMRFESYMFVYIFALRTLDRQTCLPQLLCIVENTQLLCACLKKSIYMCPTCTHALVPTKILYTWNWAKINKLYFTTNS